MNEVSGFFVEKSGGGVPNLGPFYTFFIPNVFVPICCPWFVRLQAGEGGGRGND
jgi:hypothetical protein